MLVRFSVLLSLALAASAALARQTPDPDPLAGVPNVELVYYDVSGKNAAAIRKDMNAKRPVDADGRPFITRPRLADEATASKGLLERWRRYYRALTEHEAGHANLAYEHRDDVLSAIKGATCETAQAAGQAALDRIRALQRDYDARTRHGATQGATFP